MSRFTRFNRAMLVAAALFLLVPVGCAKKPAEPKPVVIEDVLPMGAPVCFPKGMKNASDSPGADTTETRSPLRTQDLVPEVFVAPTTQPTSFTKEEQAWIVQTNVPTTTQPTTQPSSQPTSSAAHGSLNHWCQICAAAAQRAAEQGRTKADLIPPDTEMLLDLPPR